MLLRFACPYCKKELIDLKCFSCLFIGKLEDEIYHLHRSDSSWDICIDQILKLDYAKKAEDEKTRAGQRYFTSHPYAVANSQGSDDRIQEAINFIKPKDKIILDVGGSSGINSYKLVKHGVGVIINLDFNLEKLNESKLMLLNKEQYFMVFGDNYHIPFVGNFFDVVFDSAVIHHMVDRVTYLKEVYRVLKFGGLFYFFGSPPSPTKERLEDLKRHEKWWMQTYGTFETAWGVDECNEAFNATFSKLPNITHFTYKAPDGYVTGFDAVVWCIKG